MSFVETLYYYFDSSEIILNKLINFIKQNKMMVFNYKMSERTFNYNDNELNIQSVIDFIQNQNNKMDIELFNKYCQYFNFNIEDCSNLYDIFYEYLHIILGLMNQTYDSPNQTLSNYIILMNKIIVIYEYLLINIFNKENTTKCQNFDSDDFSNVYQSLIDFDFGNINVNVNYTDEENIKKINAIKLCLNNVLFNLYNNYYSNSNYLSSNYSEYNMNSALSHNGIESLKNDNIYILNDTVNTIQIEIEKIKEIFRVL